MLTPEQIKNLKPGDTILIHGTFDSRTEFGNICYISKFASENGVFFTSSRIAHPSLISLPKNSKKNTEEAPKYDPCRLFKKGDKVRVVKCKGRIKPYLKDVVGNVYTLVQDEEPHQITYINEDGIHQIDACHLELVTPVEELNPYYVEDCYDAYCVCRDSMHVVDFNIARHPHAKEAAEAECARLNEEYRKELK